MLLKNKANWWDDSPPVTDGAYVNLRHEWKSLAAAAGVFLGLYYLPVGNVRFVGTNDREIGLFAVGQPLRG